MATEQLVKVVQSDGSYKSERISMSVSLSVRVHQDTFSRPCEATQATRATSELTGPETGSVDSELLEGVACLEASGGCLCGRRLRGSTTEHCEAYGCQRARWWSESIEEAMEPRRQVENFWPARSIPIRSPKLRVQRKKVAATDFVPHPLHIHHPTRRESSTTWTVTQSAAKMQQHHD